MKTVLLVIAKGISLLILAPLVYFSVHIYIDNYLVGYPAFDYEINTIGEVFYASVLCAMLVTPMNALFFLFPLSIGLLIRYLGHAVSRHWYLLPAIIVMAFYVYCGLAYSKSFTIGLIAGCLAVLGLESFLFKCFVGQNCTSAKNGDACHNVSEKRSAGGL